MTSQIITIDVVNENGNIISVTTQATIPNEYVCPLTLEMFEQPFMTRYEHSFERDAIVQWISSNEDCPLTRKKLTFKDILPNRALQANIQNWKQELGKSILNKRQQVQDQERDGDNNQVVLEINDVAGYFENDDCTVRTATEDEDADEADLVYFVPVKSDSAVMINKKESFGIAKFFKAKLQARELRRQECAPRAA